MYDDNFIDSSFRALVSYPKLITPISFAWISFFSISTGSLFFITWEVNSFTDIAYPLFFYMIFALSYALYMEQLFMAQFYMWYREREILAIKSLKAGYRLLEMGYVAIPSILDRRNDLKKDE